MNTTKTAQFTPGPWVVNTFIVNGQHKLEVLDATGANACVQANATLIAAAPAMYDRHKDNHGMVQEALRYLYEGEYEEVKCLLNHIALNSKHAVRQAEGR